MASQLPQGEDLGYTDSAGAIWRLNNVGSHYTAKITAPAYGWAGGAELVSAPSVEDVYDLIESLVTDWKANPTKKADKRALASPVAVAAPKKQESNGIALVIVALVLYVLGKKKGR